MQQEIGVGMERTVTEYSKLAVTGIQGGHMARRTSEGVKNLFASHGVAARFAARRRIEHRHEVRERRRPISQIVQIGPRVVRQVATIAAWAILNRK